MLYVHLINNSFIGYLASHPFKLEDETATILEIDQEFPQDIAGKSIQYEWDAENKQVNFTYIDMPEEPIVEEEADPTMEEQILFETKYQTLLLETMALGGNN